LEFGLAVADDARDIGVDASVDEGVKDGTVCGGRRGGVN